MNNRGSNALPDPRRDSSVPIDVKNQQTPTGCEARTN